MTNDPWSVHSIAELLSLYLTTPTIITAVSVVILFFPAAKRASKAIRRAEGTSNDWLTLGIFMGFVGQAADNFYWAIAWTGSYLDATWTSPVFRSGVYSNIPCRQGLGLIAAYCHLRSSALVAPRLEGALNRVLLGSLVVSLAATVALVILKFL